MKNLKLAEISPILQSNFWRFHANPPKGDFTSLDFTNFFQTSFNRFIQFPFPLITGLVEVDLKGCPKVHPQRPHDRHQGMIRIVIPKVLRFY